LVTDMAAASKGAAKESMKKKLERCLKERS
jgi:hypothetical protein